MSEPIPTCEPTSFVAGDTVRWTKDLASYPPSDGWVLHYRLLNEVVDVEISDTGAAGYFDLAIAPSATADIAKDTVARMIGWVIDGDGASYTIYDAWVSIGANVRTASAADIRTHDEKMYDALTAVIENRSTSDIEQYTIGGRAVTKMKAEELMRWRGVYAARLWRQRHPGVSSPSHLVQFG